MRLTEEQKQTALRARHGASLVRVGDRWGVVWKDQCAPPRERWHAQLIYDVEKHLDPDTASTYRVWWEGGEHIGATWTVVMQALTAEAGLGKIRE